MILSLKGSYTENRIRIERLVDQHTLWDNLKDKLDFNHFILSKCLYEEIWFRRYELALFHQLWKSSRFKRITKFLAVQVYGLECLGRRDFSVGGFSLWVIHRRLTEIYSGMCDEIKAAGNDVDNFLDTCKKYYSQFSQVELSKEYFDLIEVLYTISIIREAIYFWHGILPRVAAKKIGDIVEKFYTKKECDIRSARQGEDDHFLRRAVRLITRSVVNRDALVIDYGCGAGRLLGAFVGTNSEDIERSVKGLQFTYISIDKKEVIGKYKAEVAQYFQNKKDKGLAFCIKEPIRLICCNNLNTAAHFLIIANVFHELLLKDLPLFLWNIVRWLKNKGICVVIDMVSLPCVETNYVVWNSEDFGNLFRKLGLEIVSFPEYTRPSTDELKKSFLPITFAVIVKDNDVELQSCEKTEIERICVDLYKTKRERFLDDAEKIASEQRGRLFSRYEDIFRHFHYIQCYFNISRQLKEWHSICESKKNSLSA